VIPTKKQQACDAIIYMLLLESNQITRNIYLFKVMFKRVKDGDNTMDLGWAKDQV
jgi:hypothetical protein